MSCVLCVIIKWPSLQKNVSKFKTKKFYETDCWTKTTLRIRSKLGCLFVQSLCVCRSKKMLAYYKICQFPVNYEFVMLYSKGTIFTTPYFLSPYKYAQ